jgi:hypothetical protein
MDDDESKIAEKYEALRDVMDEQDAPIVGGDRGSRAGVRWRQYGREGGWPDAADDHGGNEGAG